MPLDDIVPDEDEENEATKLGLNIPEVSDYSERDAPTDLKRDFWVAAALFNIALGGVSVGLMLVAFQGRLLFGGSLVAVGLVALVRGWRIYRARSAAADDDGNDND